MNNKILSIIIPSYNMQEYLHRSIESLLSESIIKDIEIIIVNDGSTDKTLEIAQKYYEKNPTSITIINKKNGHYGSAVNAGIAKASGTYLKVLDADDWFNTEEFILFVKKLHQIPLCDVIFTNWCLNDTYNKEQKFSENFLNPYDYKLNIDELTIKEIPLSFYSFFSLYAITYRTKFLHDIKYKQTEGICYTDVEYIYYPLIKASTAIFLDYNVYQYFIGREDQSINPINLKKNIRHHYKIYQRMIKDYENITSPVKKDIQKTAFIKIASSLYYSYLFSNSPAECQDINLRSLDLTLRKESPEIYNFIANLKYHGLPYITLWRKFKCNFHLLHKLSYILKRH